MTVSLGAVVDQFPVLNTSMHLHFTIIRFLRPAQSIECFIGDIARCLFCVILSSWKEVQHNML